LPEAERSMSQRRRWGLVAGLVPAVVATAAQAQFSRQPPGFGLADYGGGGFGSGIAGSQMTSYLIAAVLGLAVGALFSDRLRAFRRYLWIALGVLAVLFSFVAPFPLNTMLTVPITIVIFVIAVGFGLAWGRIAGAGRGRSTTFGSAQWATAALLQARNLVGEQGLALGYFEDGETRLPLHYTGDRHLLTVAPTRAGKGVSAIIPNLLTYRGSVLVIDPKGENAMISAARRGSGAPAHGITGLGQRVHIVDPWGLVADVTGMPAAGFNPLDWLDPSSPDLGENAMMLADSLVVPGPGGNEGAFWNEESKALLMGLILHVATDPDEAERRNLGRVRDLLLLSQDEFNVLCVKMEASPQPIVASTGARTMGKDAKLLSNVLASAQSHTHFLDSPRLRASLSRSDFRFEDLKRTPTTVYLVLPADRLGTFGRWLRLLIQQAITVTARNITDKPERPILFVLDEMAALGRLTMVEQAYGLMAGFGMQLWGIVQDLSQLHGIYGDGWQTFIGNSGVLQYFGSRDKLTAEYFSALCGEATVPTFSSSITQALSPKGEESSSTSHSHGEAQRKLILPDELMRVAASVQLVLVENLDPIAGRKIAWFSDERFRRHGVNLRARAAVPSARPAPLVMPEERLAAE
jgi:type IV secretion system protein VirD4